MLRSYRCATRLQRAALLPLHTKLLKALLSRALPLATLALATLALAVLLTAALPGTAQAQPAPPFDPTPGIPGDAAGGFVLPPDDPGAPASPTQPLSPRFPFGPGPVQPELVLPEAAQSNGAQDAVPETVPPGPLLPAPTPFRSSEEARLARAAALSQQQRYAEAIAIYESILAESPYAMAAHIALGRLLVERSPARAKNHIELASRARPNSSEVAYLLGRLREGELQWDAAVEAYQNAIQLDPRAYDANARLRLVLGRLAARKTDVERASEAFWARPSLASLTLFGRYLINQPNGAAALTELRRIAAERPELPEVHLWLARVLRAQGQRQAELDAYGRYLEHAPEAIGVRLVLAQRQQESGQYAKARDTLHPLTERLERSPGSLDSSAKARLAALRSANALSEGQLEQAVALLRQAADLGHPADELDAAFRKGIALHPDSAALRLAHGAWLSEADSPHLAVEALLAAGLTGPEATPNAESLLGRLTVPAEDAELAAHRDIALGELALYSGQLGPALERFSAVPRSDPRQHRAALGLGMVYRARGDTDAAIAAFTRYVFSYSTRAEMAFARGNLFWRLDQKEQALAVWQEEPGLIADYPEIQQRLADYLQQTGRAALEQQVREAIADETPEDHANRLRLGELRMNQGDAAAAILIWEKLREERQADQQLVLKLARAYLALERTQDAQALLLEARNMGPLPQDLAWLLAEALYADGRYAEALPLVWQRYLRDPGAPILAEMLPRMALAIPVEREVRLAAADLAEQNGALEDAAALLEQSIADNSANHSLRRHLAALYIRLERAEDAERVMPNTAGPEGWNDTSRLHLQAEIERELDRKPALAQTLADLTRLEPDNLALWQEREALEADLNLREAQLESLLALERLQPEEGSLPLRRAALLMEMGRRREAAAMLAVLSADHPSDPEPEWQLAQLAKALRQPQQEERHLAATLQRDPTHEAARERLINQLQRAQRWKDLTPHLEAWLHSHPEDTVRRANLITAYLQRFQKDLARPHFEQLQQRDPNRARPLSIYFR